MECFKHKENSGTRELDPSYRQLVTSQPDVWSVWSEPHFIMMRRANVSDGLFGRWNEPTIENKAPDLSFFKRSLQLGTAEDMYFLKMFKKHCIFSLS